MVNSSASSEKKRIPKKKPVLDKKERNDVTTSAVFESTDIEDLKKRNLFLEDTRRAISNILEDVSASEKELKGRTEELQKFRQAVDTSFDHTIITDIDGQVIYANHAAEVLTGYSKEEMVGKTPALWGKQMPTEFYETFWRTIKTEKNGYAGELTNRRKDGTKYLASLRVASVLDAKGEIKFFVGVERDITEERKSQLKIVRHAAELEEANVRIEEEKERTESILRFLKSIGEGVFATDREYRVIFMNEAAELMSGHTFEDSKNRPVGDVLEFFHETQSGTEQLKITERALERKRTIAFPNKAFIRRKKQEIPISGTCSLIRDEKQGVVGTITVFQDITKEHELDQMKESFLSIAAHQLRTPLGSMRWSMELLLGGDLGRLPKAAIEAVQQIYDNSQRMSILVNDLLSVARMDQHRGHEEPKPVDIATLLEEAVKTMRPEGQKRGVTVMLRKPKGLLPAISVPPKHFYETIENLLSNGIKYNKRGGYVSVTLSEKTDGFLIVVKDTGIGIPKNDQSKIFSKFFRAQNAILKETEGSGLGLSVVKSYLEEAGASIRFESEEGVGTTFFIQIPFHSSAL